MGKRSPSPPPPPDPKVAIDAQADANRYNTTTPYGNTTWSESDDGKWTQDFSFSEPAQNLFNRSLSILDRSNNGFDSVDSRSPGFQDQPAGNDFGDWINNERNLNNPGGSFPVLTRSPGSPDKLPAEFVPGSSQAVNAPQDADYSNIYDDYGNAVNERSSYLINKGFDPTIKSFQQEMANRGIPEGSEAYDDLYRSRIGDPMAQATDNAAFKSIATGEAMRTQDYNMMSNLWGRGQVAPAMPIDAQTPYRDHQNALNNNYAQQMQRQNAQYAAIGQMGKAAGGKK